MERPAIFLVAATVLAVHAATVPCVGAQSLQRRVLPPSESGTVSLVVYDWT